MDKYYEFKDNGVALKIEPDFYENIQRIVPDLRKQLIENQLTSFEEWSDFFRRIPVKEKEALKEFNRIFVQRQFTPHSIKKAEEISAQADENDWFSIGFGIAQTSIDLISDAKKSIGFDEEFKNVNFCVLKELIVYLSCQIMLCNVLKRGELILMWTALGALVEAFLMIFLIFNKPSYQKTKQENIDKSRLKKNIKNTLPSGLSFSILEKFMGIQLSDDPSSITFLNKNGVSEKILDDVFCVDFIPKIREARNFIHLVRNKDSSSDYSDLFDSKELKKMLLIYFWFIKDIICRKPDIP